MHMPFLPEQQHQAIASSNDCFVSRLTIAGNYDMR